jgi:hypothetical protein
LDRLCSLGGFKAYRCRDCRQRFRRRATPASLLSKAETRKESKKRRRALRLREFWVYAAALAAFAAVAFVITRERG